MIKHLQEWPNLNQGGLEINYSSLGGLALQKGKLINYFNYFSNKLQRHMKGQHKRCKTPLKQHQGNVYQKKQSSSPTKSATTVAKQQKQNKQIINNIPLNNLALTSPNIDISREKCQSPALTTVGTYANALTQRYAFVDGEQNLKIALELAEFHKKQMEVSRAKVSEMEDKLKKMQSELKDMGLKNQQLEERADKYEQKYRKLKQKYRELKSMEEDKSSEIKVVQIAPGESQPKKQVESTVQNEDLYKVIAQLELEVSTKNKNIQTLCHQVSECEQNSQNILQLVSILEQRVQQLTMDNSLLKGLLRERQKSESEQMSRCQNSHASGVFGGGGLYERSTSTTQDIKMVDMRRRREIMDYGIIHYQDKNFV